jgi:rfaE bifunctional protein nucleotidyltransferase chain/domain
MGSVQASLGHVSVRDKINTIAELAQYTEACKQAGQKVVLAHGTFDLLHMGHVRHLESARSKGDVLIVTVTADRHVNKGPGRPVFSEVLRAEMLAALSYVNRVAINDEPTSVNVITEIRPSVYVKGNDYANASDDVTGKIREEQEAIESIGGVLEFTDDITFSSSALLNRHFDVYSPEVRDYLECMRERNIGGSLMSMLDDIADMKVLFVGDTIIDEYRYVSPLGKASKENLVASLFRQSELFAGGVIAAANHVAGFCREVEILTCLGSTDSFEDLIRSSLKPNVKLTALTRSGMPTTLKTRFVDADYLRKLFEVYTMDDSPLNEQLEDRFVSEIEARAGNADVVIVSDFGHGLISGSAISALCNSARFLAVNAQSNAGNYGFNLITKYPRADFICIDAPEARLAVADRAADLMDIAQRHLPDRIDCKRMLLTHGRHGTVTYDRDHSATRIPAFTRQAIDTMGAGDAVLAIASPLAATGAPMDLIGFVGNAVGAIKVGIVGHRHSVEKIPLIKYLNTLLK